jgi:hypothetical protein
MRFLPDRGRYFNSRYFLEQKLAKALRSEAMGFSVIPARVQGLEVHAGPRILANIFFTQFLSGDRRAAPDGAFFNSASNNV